MGAGVAGLRCADTLTQRGFQVTIIEARNRIGGRVHQTTLPSGHTVDLGANWIHGADPNNPIFQIALKTKTETCKFDDLYQFFDEDGQVLEDGEDFAAVMWEIIEEGFKYSRENTDVINPKANLYDWYKAKVNEKYPSDKQTRERKILMQMADLWGAFVGSNVQTQSLRFLWMEEVADGGGFLNSLFHRR